MPCVCAQHSSSLGARGRLPPVPVTPSLYRRRREGVAVGGRGDGGRVRGLEAVAPFAPPSCSIPGWGDRHGPQLSQHRMYLASPLCLCVPCHAMMCVSVKNGVCDDRTFGGSNPSGSPARPTATRARSQPPGGTEETPRSRPSEGRCMHGPPYSEAGMSCHPVRRYGVWTGPIRVLSSLSRPERTAPGHRLTQGT